MRAFSASATMTSATSASASDTRTVNGADIRNSATSGRRVVPAVRAMVSTTSSIAGSASVAIIISRDEPMPPKLVPTSMPASASRARAAPRSATSATASAAQLNMRPEAKVGTKAAATQVKAKIGVGCGAEEPGGVFGDDRFLAQQLDQVAVGLKQWRPLPAHEAGLDPPRDAR